MAQVVEAHMPNASAFEVLLESLQHRPSRQRPAGARVAKDQIVIRLEDRPLEAAVEFAGNPRNAADAAGTPKATGNAPIPPADSTVAVGGHAVPTRAETRP
jgi:hypothetical protein